MGDVFVSYSSEDRGRVKTLVEHLQSCGFSVWWDRELVAGPSFDEKIEEAIAAASCVVVAWSRSAIRSRWVRAEAHEGLERNILVPVLLDDVRPPMVFRMAHTASLIGWPDRGPQTELNALITGIQALVNVPGELTTDLEAEISSKSIAVLRFADMSPEGDQAPLCDGIADEIIDRLAHIRDLKVIARNSSFQFDPNAADLREVGRQLGVGSVLEGRVRTSGDQVRITVQLIECEGLSHRWSESYTRNVLDLFSLFDEVADAVTRALSLVIDGQPWQTTRPTHDELALRLVLQARFIFEETGLIAEAMPLVERAVAIDPSYPDAHLLLGLLSYSRAGAYYEPAVLTGDRAPISDPRANLVDAQHAIEHALMLDENLVEGLWILGLIHAYQEADWGLAAESWRQADRLRGYPMRYQTLCLAGYYELSETNCRVHIERDPLNVNPRLWLGRVLDRLGRVDEATLVFQEATLRAPKHQMGFFDNLDHQLDVPQRR